MVGQRELISTTDGISAIVFSVREEEVNGRPCKYYRLTDRGQRQLARDQKQWESLALAMGRLGIIGG